MSRETWKDIPNWPGYQVSDRGMVRSVLRVIMRRNGTPQTVQSRLLKLSDQNTLGSSVIYGVTLSDVSNGDRRERFSVASLVLLTFRGPCPDGMIARHRGDTDNDTLDNVCWGYPQHGEDKPASKLTDGDIQEILKSRLGYKLLAKKYNVNPSTIRAVKKGISWKRLDRVVGT